MKVSVTPKEGGTTSPSKATFESNEEVSVSAIPSKGYYFDKWQGDLSGSDNPLTFKIKSDTDLTAVFLKLDEDGDGVSDDLDKCPDTAEGADVNENGCSLAQLDSDEDGVDDALDQCPDTPIGEQVNSVGCPSDIPDADHDGVEDDLDQCGNTPSGEQVDENGCAPSQKDSDGDGVSDALDQCAGTPEGASVNDFGCIEGETDGDGDGVSNEEDECPNTPSGEVVDEKGCSVTQNDADGDNVTDDKDQCADTPTGEAVDVIGCSDSQKDTDEDGVTDDLDQCPGTLSGESADAQGCSPSQSDKEAPVVTNFDITNITNTTFKVDWTLNEGSKGYIRFGTTPGVYLGSTNTENNFLTHHVQTVGGSNPFDLQPATTYYCQIYTEDENGNSDFSAEFAVTTLNENGQRPFIFANWDEGSDSSFGSHGGSIPTDPNYTYNYTVDWGDGHIDTNVTGDITHDYENDDDVYYIKITGIFPRLYLGRDYGFSRRRDTEIKQWGDIEWESMEEGCSVETLIITATDTPNLSNCTSLKNMFANSTMFVSNEAFDNWDVSNIRDMSGMFKGTTFVKDISNWDVRNVTDMSEMFAGGYYFVGLSDPYRRNPFNQDISTWNVSNVKDMSDMFASGDFNKNINSWDVSKVENMNGMFRASKFNQDISSWDVSEVTTMIGMFATWDDNGEYDTSFNQDLGIWEVFNVTECGGFSAENTAWTLPKPNFINCNPN